MNVLWIVNTVFPAPSQKLGIPSPVVGGWMYSLADQLVESQGVKLFVATTYNGDTFQKMEMGKVIYYLLPYRKGLLNEADLNWKPVIEECGPEIVHIHGTEYAHGLACINQFSDLNYVVSIQGLVSVYARYYLAGLGFFQILSNISFRDIVRWNTIWGQQKFFYKQGLLEKEYIRKAGNIIGRTFWDFTHCVTINPQVKYHFCNENLREGFYKAVKWDLTKCSKHSIFLSQAGYPIKGLHKVIEAVSLLADDYPDLKICIGGNPVTKSDSVSSKLRLTGYGKFVKKLIRKNGLEEKIIFLGILNENQMISQYQEAHVFIAPSSVENSPNSVGEAQIIGTPCIASYVGGVPDMITHKETGLLFRFEETEMLAQLIRMIFENDDLAIKLGKAGIIEAEKRHNRKLNLSTTLEIYNNIIT